MLVLLLLLDVVTNFKNSLAITASSIGLGSVDNTSDLDKPISVLTQNALNAKSPLALTMNFVEDYTLVLADKNGVMVLIDSDSAPRTLTVPANADVAFPIGTQILLARAGSEDVTIVGDTDVSIFGAAVDDKIASSGGVAALVQIDIDTWLLFGDVI